MNANPEIAELTAHAGFLRRLARGLVRDEHLAEDLVQDTLVVAIERPGASRGPIRGWLTGVLKNLARMRFRETSRRGAREVRAARTEIASAPDDDVASLEISRRLVDEVAGLAEPYRQVVVLRFFHDLPPVEIGRRIGVPPETVRTRLRRALIQLRGRLDESHDGNRNTWVLALLPLTKEVVMKKSIAGLIAASLFLLLTGTLVTVMATGGFDRRPEPPIPTDVADRDGPGGGGADTASESTPATGEDQDEEVGHPPDGVARIRVVGRDGRPVDGAKVEFLLDPIVLEGTFPAKVAGAVVTDADGVVEFPVDPLTRYMLRVSKPGYAIAGDVNCFGGNVTEFRLSKGGTIVGTVLDAETGRPLPGAEVYVMDWSGFGIVAEWTAMTDAEGRYRVDGIGDGLLNIHARAADRPRTGPIPEVREVRVVEGEKVVVDFRLPRGRRVLLEVVDAGTGKAIPEVTLHGGHGPAVTGPGERIETEPLPAAGPAAITVAAEGYLPHLLLLMGADIAAEGPRRVRLTRGTVVTGVVRKAQGEIAPGVHVRILVRDTDPMVTTTIDTVTDTDGAFRVRGASPGGAILWQVLRNGRPLMAGDWQDVPETAEEIRLEPILLEETKTVTGRVRDPEGNPVPYGYLAAYRPGDRGAPPRTECFLDPRGRFRLPDVPVGPVKLVLGAMEGWPHQTMELDVKEGCEIDWRFDRGYEISGRVVDAGGRPVSKQWIALTAGGSLVLTDEAGRFRIRGLDAGPHRIFLGYSRTPAATDIAGDTYDLEIVTD